MAKKVQHKKRTNLLPDWIQNDIDKQIALGNLPAGTTPSNIILSSNFAEDHDLTGIQAQLVAGSGVTIDVTDPDNPIISSSGTFAGSLSATQVAFGSGTNSIAGTSELTWNNTNKQLNIQSAITTITVSPPSSLIISFVLDPAGFAANGSTYTINVYGKNSTYTVFDSVGITSSMADPNDGQNYRIDVSWTASPNANAYIVYESNVLNMWSGIGNVTTLSIYPGTLVNSFAPVLTPTSYVFTNAALILNPNNTTLSDIHTLQFGGGSGSPAYDFTWSASNQWLSFQNIATLALATIRANISGTLVTADTVNGTQVTGTWNGNTISASKGGTGATTFTASNRVPYSLSAIALTTSPNFTFDNNQLAITNVGLGTTIVGTRGLLLANTTAAASSAQQISPPVRWSGRGWKTTATAASQSVDWIADVLPVQGTANPSSTWRLSSSVNGSAYQTRLTLTSAGNLAVTSTLQGANILSTGTIASPEYDDGNGFALMDNTNIYWPGGFGGGLQVALSNAGDFSARRLINWSTFPTGSVTNGAMWYDATAVDFFARVGGSTLSLTKQGTVIAITVASANGFAGSSSGGATPALTLSTTITGLLKGNGTAISAATPGTDYVAPGANSNITSLTGLTGAVSGPNSLTFAGVASPTYTQGKLVYDTDNESLTFFNNDSNVSLQIGQENWIRVTNNTGSSIANGAAVTITGASGGLPTIGLAQANANIVAAGLTTEAIANGAIGFVTCGGLVRGVDTSAFTAGATLYVSATTPGSLTTTAPSSPNYRVRIGTVGVSNATTGTILVTSPTTALGIGTANQILGMNNAATGQEYKTFSGTANQITLTNGAGTLGFSLPQNIATTSNVNFGSVTYGANAPSATAGYTGFNSDSYYATVDTSSGVGAVPAEQYFRLTSAGTAISTIANFFGTTSNPTLISGGYYEIDIEAYFVKATAGTVTWTFTNTAAPTSISCFAIMNATTGLVAAAPTAPTVAGFSNSISAAPTVVSVSLAAATHLHRFRIILFNSTGTSLKIQATCSAGTATPQIGSFWKCRRLPANNTGTFSA